MQMSGRGRWTVEDGGTWLAAPVGLVVVAGGVALLAAVVERNAAMIEAVLYSLAGVGALLGVAGVGSVARNYLRDRGLIWRGESEFFFGLFRRRAAERAVERPAVAAVRSPAAVAAVPRAAITARRVVAGEVIASSEKVGT